jgi:hypothetical protein
MTKPKPKQGRAPADGFYSDQFSPEELALVAAFVADPTLDDEIWMQRVLNRRLLGHAAPVEGQPPISTGKLIALAEALSIGTGRVARLLRDRRALSGEAAQGLAEAIATALDEISSEIGEQL